MKHSKFSILFLVALLSFVAPEIRAQSTSPEALADCKLRKDQLRAAISNSRTQSESLCQQAGVPPMDGSQVAYAGCAGCNALQACLVEVKYWGARLKEVSEMGTQCLQAANPGQEFDDENSPRAVDGRNPAATDKDPAALRAKLDEIASRKEAIDQRQVAVDRRIEYLKSMESTGRGGSDVRRELRQLSDEKMLLFQEETGITQEAKILSFFLAQVEAQSQSR